MESSTQDSSSDPGRSASEPALPRTETPVRLETLRGGEHQTPAGRHGPSGCSKGESRAGVYWNNNISSSVCGGAGVREAAGGHLEPGRERAGSRCVFRWMKERTSCPRCAPPSPSQLVLFNAPPS
ncbi:hypothetical protein VZT92_000024 [Zoarces viviparus]|uniref:Uncharacterized protein n=1 Tax=Zoarces viviparus TaxID=48416 RepID=A0AAW1G5N0_ZOAVI